MSSASTDPAEFGVSPTAGFLPDVDPLDHLPSAFDAWEHVAQALPKYLMSDRFRAIVDTLPAFPTECLCSPPQWERAMTLLSYIGHAYVWCGPRAAERVPANLAVPWHAVAGHLGRPPVLSYASYCLHNWRRLEAERPVEIGNIALIQGFLGGEDEEWFVLIHVDIEKQAAPAIARLVQVQAAIQAGDHEAASAHLNAISSALRRVNASMARMVERCDPYIYFHRVRPYIHGWRNHPDIPNGVVYEGVAQYGGEPQTFRGETGAQSAIVPCLDAVLGVGHAPDELRAYLQEMRAYMPPDHRAFLALLERGPNLPDFVKSADSALKSAYNACVSELEAFRAKHLEYAARYIFHQAQLDSKNPHDVGTGGTPFMPYLKKHRDETREHLIR
ncbi:MAG: PrnB family protein [Fimbriimonadaceae bacterium]